MNKNQFKVFITKEASNLSLEAQIKFLKKIRDVWIPEIIDKKLQNYTFCIECNKYIKTKSFKKIHKKEWATNVCVYVDAGYGDCDRFADVLYYFTYDVCPNCGYEKIISKTMLEIKNEHERNI